MDALPPPHDRLSPRSYYKSRPPQAQLVLPEAVLRRMKPNRNFANVYTPYRHLEEQSFDPAARKQRRLARKAAAGRLRTKRGADASQNSQTEEAVEPVRDYAEDYTNADANGRLMKSLEAPRPFGNPSENPHSLSAP